MRLDEKLGSGDVGDAGYPVPLGPYLLLHRLAKGGMGEVHLAKHGGLAGIEKYCVVKTLKRGALEDGDAVRRFMDEARVVVNLAHRHICSVFDVGKSTGRYYLAMEHVAGRDLRSVLERAREQRVTISPALALLIVSDVLEALDYAHRFTDPTTGEPLHLVHRDVSPANVMVSVEGEVKLIDFGLALSRVKEQRTEPHMVMGKIAYMAPEQLACEPLDKRTDVFAAGVMLYELLSGERFYGDLNDGGIVLAAATGDYVPPKLASLDDELQGILRAALARAKERRTPGCAELRDQLARYAVERQLSASARELRVLMEQLFPDERAQVRTLLGRFANVRALPRPATPAPESPPEPLPASFDTFDSFEFEVSEPSTPVGRLQLAKATSATAKPGTPRPELLERLGMSDKVPAAPGPCEGSDDGSGDFAESTQVIQRRAAAARVRLLRPVAAGLGLVACAALALVVTQGADDGGGNLSPLPSPTARSGAVPAAAAPALVTVVEPSLVAPQPAGDENESKVASEPEPEPEADIALTSSEPPVDAAAALEPSAPEPVARQRRKSATVTKRRRPRPVGPPGPDATPERKIRYLQASCRQKTACAGDLVDMFRGMRVDDARTFWARVDACVSRCAQ